MNIFRDKIKFYAQPGQSFDDLSADARRTLIATYMEYYCNSSFYEELIDSDCDSKLKSLLINLLKNSMSPALLEQSKKSLAETLINNFENFLHDRVSMKYDYFMEEIEIENNYYARENDLMWRQQINGWDGIELFIDRT